MEPVSPVMILLGVILLLVLVIGGIYVKGFKEWLVWAVTEAEKTFGSGTGQLKLRYAYELAINRFPNIAKFLPFSIFMKLVDEALVIMRKMIENNGKIAGVIVGVEPEEDVEAEPVE